MEKQEISISVIMATYNHESYIGEAIKSILSQSFINFELIIINDGSTDKTEEIIKSFMDKRIVYLYQDNQGLSSALNTAISKAQGKYIALMSGDDVCYPSRLKRQYEYLVNSQKKIVFSWIDIIDNESKIIRHSPVGKIFNKNPSFTNTQFLKNFFFEGNFLNAPTCMHEKSLFDELGGYNPAFIQLQDYDMWIRVAKKYDIHIIPEKLLKYRILPNQTNLSSKKYTARIYFERSEIQEIFFTNMSIELFKKTFSEHIIYPDFSELVDYEIEKSFLYLKHSEALIKNIGLRKLSAIIQNPMIYKNMLTKYNFRFTDFYKLTLENEWMNRQIEDNTIRQELSSFKKTRYFTLYTQMANENSKLKKIFIFLLWLLKGRRS